MKIVLLISLFYVTAHATLKSDPALTLVVSDELIQYLEELNDEEFQELTENIDLKDLGTKILNGHRRQRVYLQPEQSINTEAPLEVNKIKCIYQNSWGWAFDAVADTIEKADFLAKLNCQKKSNKCALLSCKSGALE